jgi:uncharacterized protein (DUF1778 family)
MKIKKGVHVEKSTRIHISLFPSELKLIDAAINKTSFRTRSQFLIYYGVKAARKVNRYV